MVTTGIVVFDPAEPQVAIREPAQVLEAAASVAHPAAAVAGHIAINGGGSGAGHRGGPVEVAARGNPVGYSGKRAAKAILQHHRLGAGITSIAPLFAVEAQIEGIDRGAGAVGEGQGDPAGHVTSGRSR